MRLLIIGLGTAGSKIADAIVMPSEASSANSGLHAIAVDNDPGVLEKLTNIEEEAKFYFPKDNIEAPELLTTRFTIDEVKGKLKKLMLGHTTPFFSVQGLTVGWSALFHTLSQSSEKQCMSRSSRW